MTISVNNLVKYYGQQKAVDGVSFSINSGDIVGFIGPNGAGKSTTMKILTGYIMEYEGNVLYNENDIRDCIEEYRSKIGYLPENNPLYHEMYVREYLEYISGIYKLGGSVNSLVDEVIQKTGLTREYKKKIASLSKGYRQRVGLASTLIHNPEILILDEPTTGLDPNQIVEIRNLIADFGKEKTILLSTHILQEVEAICDRVIIIDKGKIVAQDKTNEIATNKQSQTVIVEFLKDAIEEEVSMIEGVSHCKKVSDKKFIIESYQEYDIRENIFNFAVSKGNVVLLMSKQEQKLEDVFRELTK